MYLCEDLGSAEVLVVVLHEELAGLFVERTFGERVDEETVDDAEDVSDAPIHWIPVLLERVHADVSFVRDVRVEDLGEEVAFGRRLREVFGDLEHQLVEAALVRRGVW